jgi:hypothetical protein
MNATINFTVFGTKDTVKVQIPYFFNISIKGSSIIPLVYLSQATIDITKNHKFLINATGSYDPDNLNKPVYCRWACPS